MLNRHLNEPGPAHSRLRATWSALLLSAFALAAGPAAPAQSPEPSFPRERVDAPEPGFGLNVRSFGAIGDCKHDDTVALQSAVNRIQGHTLLIPTGCYLISRPIRIPYAQGFKIVGEGRVGTRIQQQTDDTPILVFTEDLTHSWEVRDLEFAWTRPQSSKNVNSVAILFAAPGGKGGLFDFNISHVTFDNGFRGIYLAPGTRGSLPVWGFVLEDIAAGKMMSGSTINLSPNPGVGMPRCVLRNIYSSQAIAEPQIKLNHCTSGTLEDIEDNNGVDTSLDLTSNSAISVRGLHFEVHHMKHPNRAVITAENSMIDFDGISADLWSDVAGKYYLISNVAGGGSLGVRSVILLGTSPANNPPGLTNSTEAKTYLLRLNGTVKLFEVQGVDLVDAEIDEADDPRTAEKVDALQKRNQ